MEDTRQPIGYLMGKPIYESDDPLVNPTQEIIMCELTPELVEQFIGSIIAARLADKLVSQAPKESL